MAKMGNFITPELNAIVISTVITLIIAGGAYLRAWLAAKTKQLSEIATETKKMAEINNVLLTENTQIARNIEKQTDGLNQKMAKIAAAAAFTRGRVQGRTEGESSDPYEDLYKLEEEVSKIIDKDYKVKK